MFIFVAESALVYARKICISSFTAGNKPVQSEFELATEAHENSLEKTGSFSEFESSVGKNTF